MKRDRQAFQAWVLARTGPTSDPLIATWRRGKACPVLTPKGLTRAARTLTCTPDDVAMVLTGMGAQAAIAQHRADRLFAQRQKRRGDLLDDGRYKRVCAWCGRGFISAYAQGAPTCADCKDGNAHYRHRLDVEAGTARARDHKRRAIDPGRIESARPRWHFSVMAEFNYRCAYCGMHRSDHKERFRNDLTIDHIVPVSAGGSLHRHNTAPACSACNSSKRDHDLMDWASLKRPDISARVVAKYHRLAGIYAA